MLATSARGRDWFILGGRGFRTIPRVETRGFLESKSWCCGIYPAGLGSSPTVLNQLLGGVAVVVFLRGLL
jgi:hypothetical protein